MFYRDISSQKEKDEPLFEKLLEKRKTNYESYENEYLCIKSIYLFVLGFILTWYNKCIQNMLEYFL